jgi:hypothetical protein
VEVFFFGFGAEVGEENVGSGATVGGGSGLEVGEGAAGSTMVVVVVGSVFSPSTFATREKLSGATRYRISRSASSISDFGGFAGPAYCNATTRSPTVK